MCGWSSSWPQEVTSSRRSGPFSGPVRSACSRIHSAHPRAACAAGASRGGGTGVALVGVRAHGRCGIAAVELGKESLGIALIGHTDEGLLLDLLPAFLADVRAALFL